MPRLILKSSEVIKNSVMSSQTKEIAHLYKEWAKDIDERARYYSHKQNASAPLSERYYKELRRQIQEQSRQVSKEVRSIIKNNIYIVADAVVKDQVDWLKSLGYGNSINAAFSSIPDQTVRNLVTGQIYEGGWNLNSKIWGDNDRTLKDIYTIMARDLAEQKPIYETAKDLAKYVNPDQQLKWNLKMSDGRRIYKKSVDYAAQRLARTLVQHGYQQSFVATTKPNPLITSYIWHANGSRPCPICIARDGRAFAKGDLPLDHPNGMCTMEPVVAGDMIDRLASWFNSDEGTYPELDEFARLLGYEG